ncbi:MAG: phosphonatase-like hydrolase [Bacteroidota bacterium]
MHSFSLAVFDMAGTTVNEGNVVYRTLYKAFQRAGYQLSLNLVLRYGAGKEKLQATRDILQKVAPFTANPEVRARGIHANFRETLSTAYQALAVTTFPGTEQLFADLREQGIAVVLNTGYDRATAELLLRKLGWVEGREYATLVSADEVKRGRPAPDMILLAMQRLGVEDAAQVLKVGDSIIDVEEGKNAGCGWTVGVTTGAHTREQLVSARPDLVIDALPELLDRIGGVGDAAIRS